MNQEWKAMMKRLKLESIRQKSPYFFDASGGYTMMVKSYTDKTSAGLTTAIIDFLTFKGIVVNKAVPQPQYWKGNTFRDCSLSGNTKKAKWTKASVMKNTNTIETLIHGLPVRIEIKIGADSLTGEQLREKLKFEAMGGIFFVASDFPSFLEFFEKQFNSKTQIKNVKRTDHT